MGNRSRFRNTWVLTVVSKVPVLWYYLVRNVPSYLTNICQAELHIMCAVNVDSTPETGNRESAPVKYPTDDICEKHMNKIRHHPCSTVIDHVKVAYAASSLFLNVAPNTLDFTMMTNCGCDGFGVVRCLASSAVASSYIWSLKRKIGSWLMALSVSFAYLRLVEGDMHDKPLRIFAGHTARVFQYIPVKKQWLQLFNYMYSKLCKSHKASSK